MTDNAQERDKRSRAGAFAALTHVVKPGQTVYFRLSSSSDSSERSGVLRELHLGPGSGQGKNCIWVQVGPGSGQGKALALQGWIEDGAGFWLNSCLFEGKKSSIWGAPMASANRH